MLLALPVAERRLGTVDEEPTVLPSLPPEEKARAAALLLGIICSARNTGGRGEEGVVIPFERELEQI